MTFEELLAEVYTLTDRPDLVAETKAAVKAATLKAHQSDFYSKDIFETGIEFDELDFTQSLDYISVVSNFRSLSYIRRVENEDDENGTFFEVITPREVLDSYGNNRVDIAYVAGRVLQMRACVEFQFALMGCYVLPIVTESGYSSWVAEQFPYAIVYEACRVILATVGQREESNSYRTLTAEAYQELRMSALADVGH